VSDGRGDAGLVEVRTSTSSSELPANPADVRVPPELFSEFLTELRRPTTPMQKKVITRPFYARELVLRQVARISQKVLVDRQGPTGVSMTFSAGFTDGATHAYSDFEDFMAEVGLVADPESVEMRWSTIDHGGRLTEVVVVIVTEQPVKSYRNEPAIPEAARIEIIARSDDRAWLESTVRALSEMLDSNTEIPRQFRFLLMFGRRLTVSFLSVLFGVVAFSFISNIMYYQAPSGATKAERLAHILGAADVSARFELFIRDYLRPEPSVARTLMNIAIPIIAWIGILRLAEKNLPRLFPRSLIGIGMAEARRENRDNWRSLVIFTLMGGVSLSFLASIIYGAFT
jgi:hypothetical protein